MDFLGGRGGDHHDVVGDDWNPHNNNGDSHSSVVQGEEILGNNVNEWPPLPLFTENFFDCGNDEDEEDDDDNYMYCCLPPKKTRYDEYYDIVEVGRYDKETNKMIMTSSTTKTTKPTRSRSTSPTTASSTVTSTTDSERSSSSQTSKENKVVEVKDRCLKLDDITQYDFSERQDVQKKNRECLLKAMERHDIKHLDIHYTCIDKVTMEYLIDLLVSPGVPLPTASTTTTTKNKSHKEECTHNTSHNTRIWESFTLRGINGLGDLYNYARATISSLEDLVPLFVALRNVKILNIYSCSQSRGHGLERLLEQLPYMSLLQELRLEGSEIDGITCRALVDGLKNDYGYDYATKTPKKKSIRLLSFKACSFAGNDTFRELVNGLPTSHSTKSLRTLNVSNCSLHETDILHLINTMKSHTTSTLECLHVGGNHCATSEESVNAFASWLEDDTCTLRELNLRSLWIDYYEGLLLRQVDLDPLFTAIGRNKSLRSISLSENCLLKKDIEMLGNAIYSEKNTTLSTLDVSQNDISESGAEQLVKILQTCRAIHQVKFENLHFEYKCAKEIHAHAHFNYIDSKLLTTPKSNDLPLSAWPNAFVKVNDVCTRGGDGRTCARDDKGRTYYSKEFVPDIIFRLLNAPTGNYGIPLAVRIAMNDRHHR